MPATLKISGTLKAIDSESTIFGETPRDGKGTVLVSGLSDGEKITIEVAHTNGQKDLLLDSDFFVYQYEGEDETIDTNGAHLIDLCKGQFLKLANRSGSAYTSDVFFVLAMSPN